MIQKDDIVLAIETAFRGGSLSLLRNGQEIAGWIGNDTISKSEDVLEAIGELLKNNNLGKTDVNLIAVAKGAGSLTGLRIGAALAKGLSKSFGCRYKEVSVLKSLLINRNKSGKILTAVRTNKTDVIYQIFMMESDLESQKLELEKKSDLETFEIFLKQNSFENIILFQVNNKNASDNIFEPTLYQTHKQRINVERTMAKCIGLYSEFC